VIAPVVEPPVVELRPAAPVFAASPVSAAHATKPPSASPTAPYREKKPLVVCIPKSS
jgi:hypothetical protein